MSSSQREEMIKDFIEEVKSYVPSLKQSLKALKADNSNKNALDEIHRLVHIVKGASSMVGLPGLSQIAYQMEKDLEGIVAGEYDFSEDAYEVMYATVNAFAKYCEEFFTTGVYTRDMLGQLAQGYRNLRDDTDDESEMALKATLKSTPQWEGIESSPFETLEKTPQNECNYNNETCDQSSVVESDRHRIESVVPQSDENEIVDQNFISETTEFYSGDDNRSAKSPIPELMESFHEEAEEHLEELGDILNSLSDQIVQTVMITPDMREQIRRIRRAVHTLKGAAAVIGFEDFSKFAHQIEDLLDWLYESAQNITPEIIKLVIESSDQLERIISDPSQAHSDNAAHLASRCNQFIDSIEVQEDVSVQANQPPADMQLPKKAAGPKMQASEHQISVSKDTDGLKQDTSVRPTKTLRVGMERVEELVYLAGELIISSSVFDQKMEKFIEAVHELELTRIRLRDIAREMELSYEVKALERLSPALNIAMAGNGQNYIQGHFEEFDSLELDRYSELNMIIRSLNESVVDVGAIDNQLAGVYSEFEGNINRQRSIISDLQDKIMRVRMTPMSVISNRMHRTVREVSSKLGKNVQLVLKGEDIELDRLVWEKISDPLMHLLRNAVDHGVESPEQRKVAQKPEVATITLSATREGNQVLIRVNDDGAGLDYSAIRATVHRYGQFSRTETLTDEQLAEFIFHPGFSTRHNISEISGRGVGMDIVRENIRNLRGDIQVHSVKDKGAEFTIRIPLTLAAIRALLFTSGGQKFAVALNEITEIVRGNPDTMEIQDENVIRINEELLPLYHLADCLNQTKGDKSSISLEDHQLMLIIEVANKRCAVIIDSLIGQREIVIKSLGSHLQNVHGMSGATILGDGSVVPILNVLELFWSRSGQFSNLPIAYNTEFDKPLQILIVDDSVSIRKVVSRLVESQGWTPIAAKDGVEAMERLHKTHPDLIVLDIEMPRMNGYELLGKLRSQPTTSDIPVVMLSSRATKKHKDKSLALGAKAFLVKPYHDDDFIELVRQLTQN